MQNDKLESVVKDKIRPIIDETSEKIIGVNIGRLSDDITSRLDKGSFTDMDMDPGLSLKDARARFRKSYLTRILMLNLGNISEAAKAAGIDRRTIHRMVKELGIEIKKIKDELIRPYDIRLSAVCNVIEGVLDSYKSIIHPEKLSIMYKSVGILSEDILRELPTDTLTLKDAEERFEKTYFKRLLEESNGSISKAAKVARIRYETLHRKIRALEL